jgi:hypothetical protein
LTIVVIVVSPSRLEVLDEHLTPGGVAPLDAEAEKPKPPSFACSMPLAILDLASQEMLQ